MNIVEGDNKLNVEMKPIALLPFNMTITKINYDMNKWLSSYVIIEVTAWITNPNSIPVTHQIKCAEAYGSADPTILSNFQFDRYWGFGVEGTPLVDLLWFPITLQPGGSIEVISPFYFIDDIDYYHPQRGYERANINHAQRTEYQVIIMDDEGNVSPVVKFTTP